MNSRLDTVRNWEEVVRKAGYHTDVLAEQLVISRQQLRLYILSRFALSTKRWIEKQRLQDGVLFLNNGKRIKEIALLLGYSHDTHFSRAFHREFGVTPTIYLHARAVDPKVNVPKWS